MGNIGSVNRRGDEHAAGLRLLTPSVRDTRHVAALLVKGKRVPVELAIQILEAADYTPKLTVNTTRPFNVQAGWSGNRQSIAILQSPPIPAIPDVDDDVAVHRMIVTTDSHDQGFSSFPEHHNTREASSSWFEVALVRSPCPEAKSTRLETPLPGSLPSTPPGGVSPLSGDATNRLPVLETVRRIRLYSNLHANRSFHSHSVTLTRREPRLGDNVDKDGWNSFVESARPGDRVVLYAMAQYPAWANVVRECRIEIEMKAL